MNYIFDIDGTLTPHRSHMLAKHEDFFIEWMEDKCFYLITGSDIEKVFDQLPRKIVASSQALFCCMGNVVYKPIDEDNMELLHKSEHKWDGNLMLDCEEFVRKSKYKKLSSINIESRIGMLNVSSVGRRINHKERDKYCLWDLENQERQSFVDFVNKTYSKTYEAVIGGQISVDIFPKGKDKSQILELIDGEVSFFGDRVEKGNDKGLADSIKKKKRGKSFNVKCPEDTMKLLGLD